MRAGVEVGGCEMLIWHIICVMLLLVPVSALPQVETAQTSVEEEVLPYNLDAICFASTHPPQSRLDVFIQIPYENLAFVKTGDDYIASYEVTVDISDSNGRLYSEKLWTENVRVALFEESVSPQSNSLTQRVFELPPGKYSLTAVVRDNETRTSRRLARAIVVSDFTQAPICLSDIMFVSRLTQVEGKRIMVPLVTSNVGALVDGFHMFFEAYNSDSLASVTLVTEVWNNETDKVYEDRSEQTLAHGRNQIFVRVDHSGFGMGDYSAKIAAYDGERLLATRAREFVVRWRGMPVAVKDLDQAVEQLQYIANPGDVERINEGATGEERQKRFLEFWKTKDPNPNTRRNEAMEEYYAKVEYANKHFRHYIEGWRTDMGMVYITFGAPNNVDRHPFDIDSKPYEIWSYYDLNHQFVFIDETGFGDYRLTTPIWEVWQRPR